MRPYPTPRTAERHPKPDFADLNSRSIPKRSPGSGLVSCAALVAVALASTALSAPPAAAALTSTARSGAALAPGLIFVANAGSAGGGTGPKAPCSPLISCNGSVTAYRPSATGNARPVVLVTAGINGPTALTLDSSGDLWVTNLINNTVVEYSKAELTKASPSPTVTISSPSLNGSDGLAFAPSGDLWVAYITSGVVVEFTKAQLAKSGSPAPRVTIGGGLGGSPVFDPSGNLWEGQDDTLTEYTKAQLAKSGDPVPHVTITSKSLFAASYRPAFDASGDMWVANYNFKPNVVEFTKAQVAKSGSPTARVTISSQGLSELGDVALDPMGDLWVPSAGGGGAGGQPGPNAVFEFKKAQLAKSGSPAPARTIAGPATGLNFPVAVASGP